MNQNKIRIVSYVSLGISTVFIILAILENVKDTTGLAALSSIGNFVMYLLVSGVGILMFLILHIVSRKDILRKEE